MISFWCLTSTKSNAGSLLLAKSPPSCNPPATSQFKSKISLDNPCWWELLLAGDSKRSPFKTARLLLPLGLEKPGQNDKKHMLQSFTMVLIFSYFTQCPVSVWASRCLLPLENADADIFCQPSLPTAVSWNMPSLAVGYRLPPANWGLTADGSKPQSLVLDSVLELNTLSWSQKQGFNWIFLFFFPSATLSTELGLI